MQNGRVEFVSGLVDIVGSDHVLTDPDLTAGYCTDWTRRFSGAPVAVVRPADVVEVAAVVRLCDRMGTPVVPQGGNTGLVGGGVPRGGEVLLSTSRLSLIDDLDAVTGQIDVGAGTTLAAVHERLAGTSWRFPIDFGSRDRATVGGMVSTNAGGVLAMRHGTMSSRLGGLEAVLADGSVIRRMLGLIKDGTGYDLGALLTGAEGTLGVVTAARLRLASVPRHRVTALIGCATLDEAIDLCRAALSVVSVESLELMAPECVPTGSATVLLDCAADDDPTEELAALVERAVGVVDVAVASDSVRRAELWAVRDAIPEAVLARGVPLKLDVAVPWPGFARFHHEVVRVVVAIAPDATVWRFGHAGDGNVHVNVTGVDPDDPLAHTIEDRVLRLAVACGGTIAAEHGIGIAKREWLGATRSPTEIAAFRRIKQALDPGGTLNPGVILP